MSCASQMVWPPQSGSSTTCDTTRNPFRSSNERYSAAVEARMIQRLACKASDRLPMRGTAGEHQRRLRRRMRAKHRKHPALVVMAEVKETVPRQDAGKLSAARQACAYRRRSIPAPENAAGRHRSWPGTNRRQRRDDQARSDTRAIGCCGSAPDIEDRRGRRQQRPEPVEPGLFKQPGACAALDPVLRLALVEIDDRGGFF